MLDNNSCPKKTLLFAFLNLMAIPEGADLTEQDLGLNPSLMEMVAFKLIPLFKDGIKENPTEEEFGRVMKDSNFDLRSPLMFTEEKINEIQSKTKMDLLVDKLSVERRIVRGNGYFEQTKKL